MHVHRHFKYIDDALFLINISYRYEESIVCLENFTMHPIHNDIVGPNFVKKELKEFDTLALDNILDILLSDGVIQ